MTRKLYPEIESAGGLIFAINSSLNKIGSTLRVTNDNDPKFFPGAYARLEKDNKFSQVYIAAEEKLYLPDFWRDGVCLGHGKTPNIDHLAECIDFWLSTNVTTKQLADKFTFVKPNNGEYCLYWTGSSQYGAISLNFIPDKDLSQLVNENYAVSFMVRGNSPGTKLEVRFLDSKTADPTDHPWRMNYTLNENMAAWDGYWHPVYIPLVDFVDMGSWDNAWYNPIGAFDWKAVDKFEITTDQGALTNKSFWFDNIVITNQDTAKVYENSIFTGSGVHQRYTGDQLVRLFTYPNPTATNLSVNYNLQQAADVNITILSTDGRKVKTLIDNKQEPGVFTLIWDLCNDQGQRMPVGVYLIQGEINGIKTNSKIIISN